MPVPCRVQCQPLMSWAALRPSLKPRWAPPAALPCSLQVRSSLLAPDLLTTCLLCLYVPSMHTHTKFGMQKLGTCQVPCCHIFKTDQSLLWCKHTYLIQLGPRRWCKSFCMRAKPGCMGKQACTLLVTYHHRPSVCAMLQAQGLRAGQSWT